MGMHFLPTSHVLFEIKPVCSIEKKLFFHIPTEDHLMVSDKNTNVTLKYFLIGCDVKLVMRQQPYQNFDQHKKNCVKDHSMIIHVQFRFNQFLVSEKTYFSFSQIWFQLVKCFLTRFLYIFQTGSNIKLSPALVSILVD